MSSTRWKVTQIIWSLGAILISGCFRSTLEPLTYPPESQQLLAIPDAPMSLQLHIEEPTSSVGNQFILGVIPLTRLYTPHLERDVAMLLALEAATRRYRLQPRTELSSHRNPHLRVSVKELHVSGYDLIFVRRPWAELTLAATLELPERTPRSCEVHAESATTSRFAFCAELNTVLQEALSEAARLLFDCLRL